MTQDEKFSHRMRMVRKKHNKRASKYSLDKETDLTHFGKKIGDMSKTEIRQAYIGSGDEADEQPFSYDSLISKSKEERAEARRKKMEAEAELDDLNDSFKILGRTLALRNIEQDKMAAANSLEDEDDLAFIARSFQMDNIKKAAAADRTMTEFEIDNQRKTALDNSRAAADAIARDNVYEDQDGSVFDEGSDGEQQEVMTPVNSHNSTTTNLIDLIQTIIADPQTLSSKSSDLIRMAQSTPITVIDEYYKSELLGKSETDIAADRQSLLLMKIACIIFPVSYQRHSIAVPILKILESIAWTISNANISHLVLLFEYLIEGSKFSPSFFYLAGKLWRVSSDEQKNEIMELVAAYCQLFTRESIYGVISEFFPEILTACDNEPFAPLRLHTFKPVEVLCLEPAFHEDGEQWNGNHKELREAKKLQQQYKKDKRLTAKEMRREAVATESFAAVQKQREKAKLDLERKRSITKMHEAEANYHFTKTDNGKPPSKPLKKRKKVRLGGNKQ